MFYLNVQGVNVMVGLDLVPMKDIQIQLGKINIQMVDTDSQVHVRYVDVVLDIADLRKVLVHPDTRNLWEKELRYQVSNIDNIADLFEDIGRVTDVFAKRVLPAYKYRKAGWCTNHLTLDLESILE